MNKLITLALLVGCVDPRVSDEEDPKHKQDLYMCCAVAPHRELVRSCMKNWLDEYGGIGTIEPPKCVYLNCEFPTFFEDTYCEPGFGDGYDSCFCNPDL